MTPLVLSLFPGARLLDRGFEAAGFCVVAGPDVLFGGDVRGWHVPPGRFDGVIGGPPCQAFSDLRHLNAALGNRLADNLIPEFERLVAEAAPAWFIMENVDGAPAPRVSGYRVWSRVETNRWFGGVQQRERRISFGTPDGRALPLRYRAPPDEWAPAVLASEGGSGPPRKDKGGKAKYPGGAIRKAIPLDEAMRLQGLPPDYFKHAPFTLKAKKRLVGNGVPFEMALAVAVAVREAVEGNVARALVGSQLA